MNPTEKAVLQSLRAYFVDRLCSLPVVDYLYSERVLSEDDKERIDCEQTQRDKCRKLLDILPRAKGTGKTLEKFKEALIYAKQEYLIDKIVTTETKAYTEKALTNTFEASEEEIDESELLVVIQKIPEHVTKPVQSVIFEIGKSLFRCQQSGKIMAKRKEVCQDTRSGNLSEAAHQWDTDDVCKCLVSLNDERVNREVIENFREQDISGILLPKLTEEHLKTDELVTEYKSS